MSVMNEAEETNESQDQAEGESVSTISDSITRQVPVVDVGTEESDFLKHLRAAGGFDRELRNEESFSFNKQRNARQDLAALSELFDSSGPLDKTLLNSISNEDTVGRSNRTTTRRHQQPPMTSLAALFEDPELAPPLAVGPKTASSSAPLVQPPPPPSGAQPPPQSRPAPPQMQVPSSAVAPTAVPPRPVRSPPPMSPKSVLKNPIRSPVNNSVLSPNSGGSQSIFRSTEGLPPRPNHHSRGVSWGNNTTFFPAPAPAADHQFPVLDEPAKAPDLEGLSFDSVSSLEADNHRRTNTRTQFALENLVGNIAPYEAEAESNILRALEVQQAIQNRRTRIESATSSSLLGMVPETAVHDFVDENTEPKQQPAAAADNGSAAASDALSPKQQSSKDGSERSKLLGSNSQHHPLKKKPQHRRHLSVEQTLMGLTQAMSELHGGEKKKRQNSSNASPAPEEPFSSASAFAQNATRLSEQQGEQPLPSHIRRNTRFRIDNLPMVEEDRNRETSGVTIDDSDDDPDLEDPSFAEDKEEKKKEEEEEDHTNAGSTFTANKSRRLFEGATDKLKAEWEVFDAFFRPCKSHVRKYMKNVLVYIILPMTAVATILFYFCGNPTTGTSEDGSPGTRASVSWWLLFTVRQVITFSMALLMQGLIVDFLSLSTKIMLRLVGPVLTLLIVQSKGWPFICFWWSIFDFGMLQGSGNFVRHWLFWTGIRMFTDENPSGSITSNEKYTSVLAVVACVSVVVAVKRFVIGLYLGRQTFTHYGEKLAKLMNSMLLVSEVAGLAKDIEKAVAGDKTIPVTSENFGLEGERLYGLVAFSDDGTIATNTTRLRGSVDGSSRVIDTTLRDPLTGSLPSQEKSRLMQLLGQWEEPLLASDPRRIEVASISSVLRFRKALTFIQKTYPFSYSFGPADTRENCIDSAQDVYDRLLLHTPEKPVLQFETLALLALIDDGESIDQQKAKDLVRLFRPDRQGNLTMLDFVKSVDSVYKEFRMLNASIQNSSQIDRAFENMFNVVFYAVVITITLSQLGFNPLALFLSLSSVIVAFAFMIGTASSKYFEGVLFILVRRPYGIGDRIHISGVERDTSIDGSPGWVVEHVTLFETIATWTPTKERCSLSNGSLASSRIINCARSPQAQFHVFFKIPIDTPYDKILIFKTAIEEYMKARPREWLALNGFRAHRVVADQGYVEYVIVIQHRESWQNPGQILDSKGNFSSYCNEVAKQLNMNYRAPPLPVDLRYLNSLVSNTAVTGILSGNNNETTHRAEPNAMVDETELDREAQLKEFRQLAMNKHNIRFA